MTKSKKQYKQAIVDLHPLENQIERVYQLKNEILGKDLQAEVCVRTNIPKIVKDMDSGVQYITQNGIFNSIPLNTVSYNNYGIVASENNYSETGFLAINEKIILGILDVMLQELIEKRNILISIIKTEV